MHSLLPVSYTHLGTKQPLKAEDLYPIFAKELCHQELNQTDAWIEIPEEVREMYKYYRLSLIHISSMGRLLRRAIEASYRRPYERCTQCIERERY